MNQFQFLIVVLASLALQSCTDIPSHPIPAGATGVCFSKISMVAGNRVTSFHQAIVVKGSGDALADITRMKWFNEDHYLSQHPHTAPNVWHGAWLYDEKFDLTSGPDCSKLPLIDGLPRGQGLR